MTTPTTQPVDLAEAREFIPVLKGIAAGIKKIHADSSVVIGAAADRMSALADEVEMRRDDQEFWKGRVEELTSKLEAVQAELASLKAVGPDGLPPN